MEIRRKRMQFNGPYATAYAIGDEHLGLISTRKDKIAKAIDIIKNDPTCIFWVGMGDYIDSITHRDRRYETEALDKELDSPVKQQEYLCELLEPITDLCIGLHIGNHEQTLAKEYGDFVREQLCKRLEVDYLGYVASQILEFPEGEMTLFSTHGAGSINSHVFERPEAQTANEMIALRRKLMQLTKADLYLMGHIHKLIVVKPPARVTLVNKTMSLTEDGENGIMVEEYTSDWNAWLATTGSFIATYAEGSTNYAERELYRPLEIGMIKITFDRKGNIVNVEKVLL